MAQTDVPTRVREIFTLEKGDHRQGEELLKLWRENYRDAYKEAQKSGSSFLLLALTFSLLATTSLDESTVFGLKFRSVQVPLTLLYIAAGYMSYRAISLYSFAQLLDGCIRPAMEQLFSNLDRRGLTDLTYFPAVDVIENALWNIETEEGFFKTASQHWSNATFFIGGAVCLCWLIWGAYIMFARQPIPLIMSLPSVLISLMFVTRGVVILIHVVVRMVPP